MKNQNRWCRILSGSTFLLVYLVCTASSTLAAKTYVAMGASDAVGIGAFPPTKGYVFLIQRSLRQCAGKVRLIDLGIPGGEISQFLDIELPLADLADPDLVTIWAGPNDLISGEDPAAFEADLNKLFSALKKRTSAQVVAANIPDLTKIPRFRENPSANVTLDRIGAFNQAIGRQARQFNIPVVDLFSVALTDSLVSDIDGFHPNNKGHALVARLFLSKIRPRFCPRRLVATGKRGLK